MKDKIYLGIIVLLIFAVAISYTVDDAKTAELKDKVAEMENLEKTNADLEKKIDNLDVKLQDLRTELAVNAAEAFKRKQYTVNYDGELKAHFNAKEARKEMKEKYGEYATVNQMTDLMFMGISTSIEQLSHETKSSLSMKNITFEVGNVETEDEVSLNYEIVIAFEPIGEKGKQGTIINFGQMRVLKTEDGWKVNKDLEQMKGIIEVKKLLSQQ
ncbi:hypothetical protein [Virgibacillus doumboii]|uniref:hypothetical protein n=1 Tax=Virgibacillus doumboii TaxID=2697503 RepID=UPI0013DF019C|nr:hypothetical protein [Virgibacillus doumboii]